MDTPFRMGQISPFETKRGSLVIQPPQLPDVDPIRALGWMHSLLDDNGNPVVDDLDSEAVVWVARIADHAGYDFAVAADFGQADEYNLPLTFNQANAAAPSVFDATSEASLVAQDPAVNIGFLMPPNFSRDFAAPSDGTSGVSPGESMVTAIVDYLDRWDAVFGVAGRPDKMNIISSFPQMNAYDAASFAQWKLDCVDSPYAAWTAQLVADVQAERPAWASIVQGHYNGSVLAGLLSDTVASGLAFDTLFRDHTGPHGNDDLYILIGMILCMEWFGNIPEDYDPSAVASAAIDPIISNNWAALAQYVKANFEAAQGARFAGPVAVLGSSAAVTVSTAADGFGIEVELTGSATPVGATSYEVTFDDGASWTDIGSLSSATRITGLAAGSAQTANLRATNANGPGYESRDVSVNVGANVAPSNTAVPVVTAAAEGGTVAYTAGTWTGTPAPTITTTMTVGGTARDPNTYTFAAGDVGAQVVITETADNGQPGADPTAVSAAFVVTAASSGPTYTGNAISVSLGNNADPDAAEVFGPYPAAGWVRRSGFPNFTATNLPDNGGNATTADLVGGSEGSNSDTRSTATGPVQEMMRRGRSVPAGPTAFDFTEIPYALYDVFVCFDEGSASTAGHTAASITDGVTTVAVPETTGTTNFTGTFVEGQNYALFSGKTGSSLTITPNGGDSGTGSFAVTGIQLVERSA